MAEGAHVDIDRVNVDAFASVIECSVGADELRPLIVGDDRRLAIDIDAAGDGDGIAIGDQDDEVHLVEEPVGAGGGAGQFPGRRDLEDGIDVLTDVGGGPGDVGADRKVQGHHVAGGAIKDDRAHPATAWVQGVFALDDVARG